MSLAGWNSLHNQKMKVKPQAGRQKKQIFLRLCHTGEWDVLLSCRAAGSQRKPRVQKACRQACVAATNCYFPKIVLIPNECCGSAMWHCHGILGATNASWCSGHFSAMSIWNVAVWWIVLKLTQYKVNGLMLSTICSQSWEWILLLKLNFRMRDDLYRWTQVDLL